MKKLSITLLLRRLLYYSAENIAVHPRPILHGGISWSWNSVRIFRGVFTGSISPSPHLSRMRALEDPTFICPLGVALLAWGQFRAWSGAAPVTRPATPKFWEESGEVYGCRKLYDDLLDHSATCCRSGCAADRPCQTQSETGYKRPSHQMVAASASSRDDNQPFRSNQAERDFGRRMPTTEVPGGEHEARSSVPMGLVR